MCPTVWRVITRMSSNYLKTKLESSSCSRVGCGEVVSGTRGGKLLKLMTETAAFPLLLASLPRLLL